MSSAFGGARSANGPGAGSVVLEYVVFSIRVKTMTLPVV